MMTISTLQNVPTYNKFIQSVITVDDDYYLTTLGDKLMDSQDQSLKKLREQMKIFSDLVEDVNERTDKFHEIASKITSIIEISEKELGLSLLAYDCLSQGWKKWIDEGKKQPYYDFEVISGHPHEEIVENFEKLRLVKKMQEENRLPSEPIVLAELPYNRPT